MNHRRKTDSRSQGFTRLELLIVTALLIICLFLFSPVLFERGQRTKARLIYDSSNLKQIGVAFYAYAQDHHGVFPIHPKDTLRYIPGAPEKVFFSHFQEDWGELISVRVDGSMLRYGSYVFLNLGLSSDDIENPGALIVAYTAKVTSDHTRRCVLFADGHTEIWEEDVLRDALPREVDIDAQLSP